ncbi:gliding motility-associated peptidyl-prolyl isomerase GldI [Flavobacterium alvei]|uniref:Peptidyl-prolyl cis-trans isomerase n=1 Tax=Flavobacterium alvei TaxID=2080416 RepID=A0A2S5A0Y1_9FLAO|nr:gliding motility-associated peptidyl-prolyl isomerase GldI [Flavobacterium alvei]POY35922.1 gliding motility-associated peptidyl-prolyl isomerase GldI [Flavobacterium alvei]
MNYRKLIVLAFWVTLFITSCKQSQEARKPVSQASGSFMKKSAERNKKLIASEEGRIDSLIKSNPKIKYLASTKGYWYTYITANTIDTLTPKKGDVAFFDYEIKDLQGRIIYSEVELKPQTYAVDKQNIMTGLREGIKIMHKNEKITFLFPSHIAYGYHGDTKKIGTNQPLLCTVTLHNFISEEAFKKEILLRATNAANPTPNQETVNRTKSVNKIKDSLTN